MSYFGLNFIQSYTTKKDKLQALRIQTSQICIDKGQSWLGGGKGQKLYNNNIFCTLVAN